MLNVGYGWLSTDIEFIAKMENVSY